MSAINISASQAEVVAMCDRLNIHIGAIKRLLDGGTRVVLMNAGDTAVVARAFDTRVADGVVRRAPESSRQIFAEPSIKG